jgi:hypothetical protein
MIAPVIVKLMENKQEWIGSATELLADMETLAGIMKVNIKSRAWPKSPNILIRRLNEVKATLEEVKLFISRGLDNKTKVKTVEIRKTPLLSLPNEEVNRAQNENSNDSNDINDTLHDSTEANKIKLPCDYCHQPFTNRTELIAHMDKESAAAVAEYERKRTEEL